MKKSLISVFYSMVVFLLCFYAATAGANEEQYQTEISALYGNLEAGDDFKMTTKAINGEVFFAPVNTKGHPYAEAAFLERIGSASLAAFRSDIKATGNKGDGMTYMVGVNIAQPGFPVAVELMYSTSNFDYGPPSDSTFKSKGYGLRVGNYFTDHLLAGVELSTSKTDASASGFAMTFKSKDYGLFARYAGELSKGKHVSFEGNVLQSTSEDDTDKEKNTSIGLSADYFFNRALSTGIGLEKSSGDSESDEGMTYSANIRYFFTPRYSVQLGYDRFLNSNEGSWSDWSYNLTLAARF